MRSCVTRSDEFIRIQSNFEISNFELWIRIPNSNSNRILAKVECRICGIKFFWIIIWPKTGQKIDILGLKTHFSHSQLHFCLFEMIIMKSISGSALESIGFFLYLRLQFFFFLEKHFHFILAVKSMGKRVRIKSQLVTQSVVQWLTISFDRKFVKCSFFFL